MCCLGYIFIWRHISSTRQLIQLMFIKCLLYSKHYAKHGDNVMKKTHVFMEYLFLLRGKWAKNKFRQMFKDGSSMEMVRQRTGIGGFRGCWVSRSGGEGRTHHSYKDLNKVRKQSKSGRRWFWAEETVSEKALSCVRNTKGPDMVRAQRQGGV